MTTDLDSRLSVAAGALRRSVADLPIGEPRRPGRSPVALGLGVLVVAGVLAVTLAVRTGGGPVDLDVSPAVEVQPLILDAVPDGLEVGWVGEQTAQAAAGAEAGLETDGDATAGVGGATTAGPVDLNTYIYGNVDADAPFETSDMVVNVWDSSTIGAGVATYADADVAASGGTAVAVRGHEGIVGTVDAVSSLRWYEAQDLEIVLASRSLTTDQLLLIAEGLVIEGTAISLGAVPSGIPGALDEVAALSGTTVAGARATVASWIGYTGIGGDLGQVLDVTTLQGGASELMALVWQLGATTQVPVRGQQAFLAAGAGVAATTGALTGADEAVELVWQEASGVLVHVTALGLSQTEVLNLVNGLQASTADEWDAVSDLAVTAQAAAAAQADAGTDVAADVDAGAGVDAGNVTEDAGGVVDGATDAVTNLVADVQTTLHEDLGTAAVVGTLGSVVAGVGEVTGSADAEADTGVGGLLDP